MIDWVLFIHFGNMKLESSRHYTCLTTLKDFYPHIRSRAPAYLPLLMLHSYVPNIPSNTSPWALTTHHHPRTLPSSIALICISVV